MAEKFIQEAIKHPGALRKTVGKKGMTKGGTIKASVLRKLASKGGVTGKRARFAETLKGLRK